MGRNTRAALAARGLTALVSAALWMGGCAASVDPSTRDGGREGGSPTDGAAPVDARPLPDAGPPVDGATVSCRTAADCTGPGERCLFNAPQCGGVVLGRCGPVTPCFQPETYCGCDGTTFQACEADRPFARTGPCEAADGGGAPDSGAPAACSPTRACPSGLECIYPPGCAMPTGRCQTPTDCAAIRPYCGCDGMTFMDCPGGRASRPYAREGACESPMLVNCDPVMAACFMLPPVCPRGQVPSVMGACWGPCVPFEQCAPIPCPPAGATCPTGLTCDAATRLCRP